MQKVSYVFSITILLMTSIATAAIQSPISDPSFIIAKENTEIKITAYIPDEDIVQGDVLLFNVRGSKNIGNELGSLNDDGRDGDEVVGDKVYTITFDLIEEQKQKVLLRMALLTNSLSHSAFVIMEVYEKTSQKAQRATKAEIWREEEVQGAKLERVQRSAGKPRPY